MVSCKPGGGAVETGVLVPGWESLRSTNGSQARVSAALNQFKTVVLPQKNGYLPVPAPPPCTVVAAMLFLEYNFWVILALGCVNRVVV